MDEITAIAEELANQPKPKPSSDLIPVRIQYFYQSGFFFCGVTEYVRDREPFRIVEDIAKQMRKGNYPGIVYNHKYRAGLKLNAVIQLETGPHMILLEDK